MKAQLLVDVRGLSGRLHPAGTEVTLLSDGDEADALVGGDWLALRGFEYVRAPEPRDDERRRWREP